MSLDMTLEQIQSEPEILIKSDLTGTGEQEGIKDIDTTTFPEGTTQQVMQDQIVTAKEEMYQPIDTVVWV